MHLDSDEVRWVRGVLRRGDAALDIGAHKGAYTYWMRRAVGAEGSVTAFEPQPELAAYLRRCAAAFRWGNVGVEAMGLSDAPGRATLRVPGAGPSPSATVVAAGESGRSGHGGEGETARESSTGGRTLQVPLDTVDRYLAGRDAGAPLRLIKCDVEGHELSVFRGARRTLEGSRPMLLFECEARHDPTRSVQEVFDFLAELGYAGSFFLKGRRVGVERFEAETHQVPGQEPYVNNFVFVPKDG